MDDLPRWVWNAVIALQEWHDEHPPLYERTPAGGYARTGSCACGILNRIPDDVQKAARVLAADRRHAIEEN